MTINKQWKVQKMCEHFSIFIYFNIGKVSTVATGNAKTWLLLGQKTRGLEMGEEKINSLT